ncbi:hypothetical protein [Spiroplasma alleghenense]|uniref:Uncharacterized protein n=1 Tax=Spiroplasma alleghenense TaxID=216931 RepID=A0A345Z3D3_9MOLU|nr:hypothetical protein [Spiroplasma alleghenense]AXK51112.1 hypothetical protein SALLE_v1c04380 [Spiroplasma alleghenense]
MFKKIINELRINKKIAQIFWLFVTLIIMLLFLIITWNVAGNFERGQNGFKLLRGGIYFIFVNNASRASQGYIISGAVLAFFPMIIIFPIFYFKSTNYLINFKIKKYFPQVINYSRWSKMIHMIILILIFFTIGAIITTSNGGSLKPRESYKIILWAFDISNIEKHTAGIGMWLVCFGAMIPTLVLLIWILSIGLSFVFSKWGSYISEKKALKLSKKQSQENQENNDII